MTDQEKDPVLLFDKWFSQAKKAKIKEVNAVNLATCSKKGLPSNRNVLLKDYDSRGFVFYTNLKSRKGLELSENPYASLCFYWKEIDKQVRIEGKVEKVSDEEADSYFDSRPFESRIGAIVSKQSQSIKDSDMDLLAQVMALSVKSINKPVKRPDFWSGFRVVPNSIEFWQKGRFRIHKRVLYSLSGKSWKVSFLYP